MTTQENKSASDPNAPEIKNDELKKTKVNGNFPIVGIGASAGGLEALSAFFANMPPDADIAFVIIQHLSPQHKSAMAELLSGHTPLAVREINDGTRLAPRCVYISPSDKNVAIFNRTLHLMEPVKSNGINMPIDFFFRSFSEDQKEKAIGIILSGTASDGTLGIKAIKGEAGMTMVQDPETAKYDGMPKSAADTGLVDFILPVEKMPQALLDYLKHPFLKSRGKINLSDKKALQQLSKIHTLVRSATGHDFSKYKPTTIQRRIERRLAVHQLEGLDDYLLYLQRTNSEVKALFKDLLIGVTGFFRDPDAFKALEKKGLEKILQHKMDGDTLRCWVAGCSTGEEAYSLAMLTTEVMEKSNKRLDVQIFASDIDEAALLDARHGVYPANIATDVSKERLSKFFTQENGTFRIKKQIRDMVVFSSQSVINDPPFSKLDLLSCRNLLIYMEPALQKKVIPLFHYALKPDGLLFLGTSETIGEFEDLFLPLDAKCKVYKRSKGGYKRIIDFPTSRTPICRIEDPSGEPLKPNMPVDTQALVEKAILVQYAPAAVLINDKYEILHFVGRTERYLVPPTGKPSFNLLNMARPDLKIKLTTAILQATRENEPITSKGIRVKGNGQSHVVDLTVSPFTGKDLPAGLFMVIFEDKTSDGKPDDVPPKEALKKNSEPIVRQLEQELQSTREYLQDTIEKLETSYEDLKCTNEEMQSINEELQSANEELESSKEELQATNEELNIVNEELQNKVHEVTRVKDDLNNLLAANDIASIFLDTSFCVQRYTPAAARIIKLIPTDIGRPLADLRTSFPSVELSQLAQRVLNDLNTVEMTIVSEDQICYLLKVTPYRTTDNIIDGVVMTLVNIHQPVKRTESKRRRMATVLENSIDAVMVQDFEGHILEWNSGAETMYGWTESEALKINVSALIPRGREQEYRHLIQRVKKGEIIQSLKTQRKTKSGKILDIWLTATALTDEKGRPVEMATTERDLAWLIDG